MLIHMEEIRICHVHGETVFAHRKGGRWRCRKCEVDSVTRWRKKHRAEAVAQAGGCCILCGYNRCISALQFHHLDPTTKIFGLSGSGQTRSKVMRQVEIEKCVLLCANCHAEVEAGFTEVT